MTGIEARCGEEGCSIADPHQHNAGLRALRPASPAEDAGTLPADAARAARAARASRPVAVEPCPECGGFRFVSGEERHASWCNRRPASGPTPTPVIAATEDHPAIYRDGHRLTATPPVSPSSSLGAATARPNRVDDAGTVKDYITAHCTAHPDCDCREAMAALDRLFAESYGGAPTGEP